MSQICGLGIGRQGELEVLVVGSRKINYWFVLEARASKPFYFAVRFHFTPLCAGPGVGDRGAITSTNGNPTGITASVAELEPGADKALAISAQNATSPAMPSNAE